MQSRSLEQFRKETKAKYDQMIKTKFDVSKVIPIIVDDQLELTQLSKLKDDGVSKSDRFKNDLSIRNRTFEKMFYLVTEVGKSEPKDSAKKYVDSTKDKMNKWMLSVFNEQEKKAIQNKIAKLVKQGKSSNINPQELGNQIQQFILNQFYIKQQNEWPKLWDALKSQGIEFTEEQKINYEKDFLSAFCIKLVPLIAEQAVGGSENFHKLFMGKKEDRTEEVALFMEALEVAKDSKNIERNINALRSNANVETKVEQPQNRSPSPEQKRSSAAKVFGTLRDKYKTMRKSQIEEAKLEQQRGFTPHKSGEAIDLPSSPHEDLTNKSFNELHQKFAPPKKFAPPGEQQQFAPPSEQPTKPATPPTTRGRADAMRNRNSVLPSNENDSPKQERKSMTVQEYEKLRASHASKLEQSPPQEKTSSRPKSKLEIGGSRSVRESLDTSKASSKEEEKQQEEVVYRRPSK